MNSVKDSLRSMRFLALIAGVTQACLPARAQIEINFDEFPSGTVITSQYSAVATFSSSNGNENFATEFSGTVTPPNMLCSGPTGGPPDCLKDTYIDFTMALFRLQFTAILQNSSNETVAQFNIFEHGVHTDTQFLTGLGHPGNRTVHLGDRNFITRLEIVNISAPVGWDTFVLTQVPEPASFIWLSGLGSLALRRRRRR